jgi:type II pantothenate kinase
MLTSSACVFVATALAHHVALPQNVRVTERLYEATIAAPPGLPSSGRGVDAGLTLTKIARVGADGLHLYAVRTADGVHEFDDATMVALGITGARAPAFQGAAPSQEIDAAARGVRALLPADTGDFMLVLLGTGTAFAGVRDGRVAHLGGTPLGGGSFTGIARAVHPPLTYGAMIAAASRGDRTRADIMVSDAYPEGIGRIGPDLTAAHLSKAGGSLDDFLAALLNLHGEGIAQIAGQRALLQKLNRIVLCGGFAHENPVLVSSITFMAGLFGVSVQVAPHPGFAGAIGAMILAAEASE